MIHVVIGILYNDKGELLLAEREKHKFQGGRWEFPGGKVEADEDPLFALRREMVEEVGIDVVTAKQWRKFEHAYPDRVILLDVWCITSYTGEPHGKEGQKIRWVKLDTLPTLEIPDANWDIVKMLME